MKQSSIWAAALACILASGLAHAEGKSGLLKGLGSKAKTLVKDKASGLSVGSVVGGLGQAKEVMGSAKSMLDKRRKRVLLENARACLLRPSLQPLLKEPLRAAYTDFEQSEDFDKQKAKTLNSRTLGACGRLTRQERKAAAKRELSSLPSKDSKSP